MKKYFLFVFCLAAVLMSSFSNSSSPELTSSCSFPDDIYCSGDSSVIGISYSTISRNKNASFSVFTDKIRQDNTSIGFIHEGKKRNWEGAHFVYEISLPNKTKIAEAAIFSKDAKEVTVWTYKDNKKQKIPMYKGSMEMDVVVVKYLIERGYL